MINRYPDLLAIVGAVGAKLNAGVSFAFPTLVTTAFGRLSSTTTKPSYRVHVLHMISGRLGWQLQQHGFRCS